MTDQQEKKNNRIALVSTIGIHSGIMLLMFFIIAWRAPNPPLSDYGVVLNFGLENEGSGDVQPLEPVGTEKSNEEKEEAPAETKVDEKIEETKPDEEQVVSETESPVVVKEKKEEVKEKKVEKEVEKPVVKKEDANAVYKPSTAKTNSEKTTTDGKAGKPGNQGDDENKTGDKGDPQGSVDSKAMYGKPGGGGGGEGSALDLYGWNWDNIPSPNVSDNETGKIVFLIEVDEDGNLQGYRKESSSVSIATERACIAAIEKLTFSKKSSAKVPPVSKGRITFVIRAK